ncbi:MAG: DUF104 domain-containing protein [Pirellulaceae bacterium]|nr:DUF104 domain-containing protein [Pirellulaceae bacterium]
MQRAIDAIYENGMFRPIGRERLAITEGRRVRITVDDEGDPEALIAATAIENALVLATNNLGDFGRFAGLRIDNWLAPT